MKPIYISMFIEKRYGDEWRRVFPKKRVQIEYLGETSIYWRGLGGGFALRMVQMTGTGRERDRIIPPSRLYRSLK